jgi:vacuolar-type H+-ATPase subunit F/Vma7
MNVISIDAALINIGVVVVNSGMIVESTTLTSDTRKLSGVEKYVWIAENQAAALGELLERYSNSIPVIIEIPTNSDGKAWQKWSSSLVMLAAGICYGVAASKGFKTELVPVGDWGAGKRAGLLSRVLPKMRGVKLSTPHEVDAAGMAAWWLKR